MEPPASHNHPAGSPSPDYAPYPKLDPADLTPPPLAAAGGGGGSQGYGGPGSGIGGPGGSTTMPADSNPYVTSAPAPPSAAKNAVDTVKDVLGRFGKKVGETAKKTEDLAGNMWQHLKTGPSVADAAMGRIVQGTKVIAEGGYEKIFQQTFETLPEEHLKKSYACYLSTSAGPVMGTLFLSTAKIAFCSDSPLSYKVGDQTEWSYYKVVVPFHQLRSVNPLTSSTNPGEKYIQVVSVDNHEFWFMAFVQYDSAVKNLQEAVHGGRNFQS